MKLKLTGILVVAIVMSLMVSVVGAQQEGRPRVDLMRDVVQVLTDETGLTAQEIIEEVRAGSTLADVVTANGGNVDDIVTMTAALITERVNEAVADGSLTQERADEALADLEARITAIINGEQAFPDRFRPNRRDAGERFGRELLSTVIDSTGLEPAAILQALRDGATMAQLIEDNGGDVDAIVTDVSTAITERVNEAVANGTITQEEADRMLEDLEQRLRDAINGEADIAGAIQRRIGDRDQSNNNRDGRGLIEEIATAAGVDADVVTAALQDGSTPAEVLVDNGVTVEAFVATALTEFEAELDEAVADGRMTQAVADARLTLREAQLLEALERAPGENFPNLGRRSR